LVIFLTIQLKCGLTIKDKKIIYLGFQKCGTTSFWKYFGNHGFRVIHNTLQVCDSVGIDRKLENGKKLLNSIDTMSLDKFVENYDVLTDNPFPLLYEYFDRNYAHPLFVLGTRPTNKWLSSMQRYFGTRMPALGNAIYSSDTNPCTDPEALIYSYEKHTRAVRQYFSGRDNFLEIKIGEDSDLKITQELEDFVGLPKNTSILFGKHLPK